MSQTRQLGDFRLHALSDGSFALDGGQMFGVVPKPLWERTMPADERNRVRLSLTCLLVETGSERVLIETGLGDKFNSKFASIYDVQQPTTLLAELAQCGFAPEDISIVINTHLHFDHCGWNTRRDGGRLVPTFPRARYYIQRAEWDWARHPTERDRGSYIDDFFLAAEAQTRFVDGDVEIAPGVRVEVLPGHTPNLQGVWIESRGERALFISDLVPMQPHLAYPWIMAFDLEPLRTLATKKRILPQLVRENVLTVFPHDTSAPWARLAERDGRVVAVPLGVASEAAGTGR